MKMYAARYYHAHADYEIVLFRTIEDMRERPHDYQFSFDRKDWRKMGGKVPPKGEDGYIAVDLTVAMLEIIQ